MIDKFSKARSEFVPIFGSGGNVPASHEDVVYCYNLILGRNPENLTIFREALGQPVHAILKDMIASEEFSAVFNSLGTGETDRHRSVGERPSENLLFWINRTIVADDDFARSVLLAKDWVDLLQLIVAQPEIAALLAKRDASNSVIQPQLSGNLEQEASNVVICVLEEFSPNRIAGWAAYRGRHGRAVSLSLIIDGELCTNVACNLPCEQLTSSGYPALSGFKLQLPPQYFDGSTHHLKLEVDRKAVSFEFQGEIKTEHEFSGFWLPPLHSFVDGFDRGAIKGWALRATATDQALRGGRTVQVTHRGETVVTLKANRYRPDVAQALGADAYCGFVFEPPFPLKRTDAIAFHFLDAEDGSELANSPCSTSFGEDHRVGKLLALQDAVDRLSVEIEKLKQDIRSLVSRRHYNIEEYDRWFRDYVQLLRVRVARERSCRAESNGAPLVSIIYATPRSAKIIDFEASIESAINQTYRNWELLIVWDDRIDEEFADCMGAFTSRESRIKSIKSARGASTSAATSAAIKAAKGDWVAFFEHGDLLVDVALELMVSRTTQCKASLAYSDEDRFDASGYYSEPAFKPDWNYRLLLSCDYVSHLLFVKRWALSRVGRLRTKFGPAQGHDLVLRLSEIIGEEEIIHVPEMLYHAKKAANTAGGRAKTIEAGVAAITDHLARKGRDASVSSIHGVPMYSVRLRAKEQPLVNIIIPFRDEVLMTSRCLSAVLGRTKYRNFRITLVDNWSVKPETKAMVRAFCEDPRITCLLVEEEFNFSRLNNLAACSMDSDFIFFMNNDLVVMHDDWLDIVVCEALMRPAVAAVGGKFLYPNGTVQHAGVILGLWGVAGHVHKGIAGNAAGYGARAVLAQEVSAVTAAGMLVRTALFKQVGQFDEVNLRVAFNDIDLCLRLREAGFKIVWSPDFLAEHYESLSRGRDDGDLKKWRSREEIRYMRERWGDKLTIDPYYSRWFDLDGEPFFDLSDPGELIGNSVG